MYQFSITDVTNYHRHGGLNNINLFSFNSGIGPKTDTSLTALKMSVGLHYFLEALRKSSFPCIFQYLPTFFVALSPHLQSQQWWVKSFLHCHLSVSLIWEEFSAFQDSYDEIGSTWIIQDNFLHLKVLNLMTAAAQFLSCNIFTDSKDYQGVDIFGGHYSTQHSLFRKEANRLQSFGEQMAKVRLEKQAATSARKSKSARLRELNITLYYFVQGIFVFSFAQHSSPLSFINSVPVFLGGTSPWVFPILWF